jgi:hypothetical protein
MSVAADGIVIAGAPDSTFAALPVANVSSGLGSVGLFRFTVAPGLSDATLLGARLTFTYAAQSTSCASGCGSCSGIDMPGSLALFPMRSDWVERSVTFNARAAGQPWGAPGASLAGVDRAATPVATIDYPDDSSVTFTLDAAQVATLWEWAQGDQLSVQLLPTNGAVFVIAAREYAGEGCGDLPSPRLEIDFCP